MTVETAVSALQEAFPDAIRSIREFRGEQTIVTRLENLRSLLEHCHSSLNFDYLVDISSLDHFGEEPRFEVVYELYSYEHRIHLRLRAPVSEDDLSVPTVTDLWPTANWHEREIYDMMGIRFEGHPDLRRILMWEGYPFYPLRKDFPLGGKPSEMPDVAFTGVAPLEGGPFVTCPTDEGTVAREPRARP